MPGKIPKKAVCDRLLKYAADRLDTSSYEDDLDGSTRLTYVDFAVAMAAEDFISSAPTVRAKWTMLCADGIISAGKGSHIGVLYWGALKSACTPSVAYCIDRLVAEEKKQKNKKTNTEAVA